MFLLVNPLLIEDANLTRLQTEPFCLQNRYKTSSGRERVSATHTAPRPRRPPQEGKEHSGLGLPADSSSRGANRCHFSEQLADSLESDPLEPS